MTTTTAPVSTTVAIAADHDGDCTSDLRRRLEYVTGGVTIDLSHVPYLTSSALTELVRLRKRLRDERIVLYAPNPLVFRTLNVVGFNKMFAIDAVAQRA